MVEPREYFFYLKRAFKKNHVHGYMIDKKASGKTCIFMEDGKWNVALIKNKIPIDQKVYDADELWTACEDIIARLARNEKHRKEIWMDWASPTNWAEKMDVPITFKIISKPNAED